MSRRSSRSSRRSRSTPIKLITASSATNAIASRPRQLKSLGAAPCASSTATCKTIASDNGMELTSNAVLISNIDDDCHQSYLLDETYGSDVANRSRQHSARHRRDPENSSHLPRRADRRARADDHPPAAPVLLGAIWSNPLHGGNADLDLRALSTCFGPAARPLERPHGPQAPPHREPGGHLPGILDARLRKLPAADLSFPHHRRLDRRQYFLSSGLYFRCNAPRKTCGRIRQDRHGFRDRFLPGPEPHVLPLPVRPQGADPRRGLPFFL